MAALFGIEWPEAGKTAPAQEMVTGVRMFECNGARAKIEGGCWPNPVSEVSAKGLFMGV
jgi:hypothetical protein